MKSPQEVNDVILAHIGRNDERIAQLHLLPLTLEHNILIDMLVYANNVLFALQHDLSLCGCTVESEVAV